MSIELKLKYKCKTTQLIWLGRKVDTNKYKVKNPDTEEVETIGLAELNKRFKSVKGNISNNPRLNFKNN